MKFTLLILLPALASAFVPPTLHRQTTTARNLVDPSILTDLHHHVFTTINLADAATSAADAAASAAVDTAAEAVDNGWFGFLTGPIESVLLGIHSLINTVGLQANSWGIAIIILTALIKALTFPLTKSQLESTTKMQSMQPAIKDIQAKYQSNPEVMNQKIAEFYQTNEINPLAGCIPSLVQIPVFIGLYRAVLNLAKENKLNESFLWLPSLEGPTYGAEPANAADWILKGWTDGAPALGWDATIAFLILPTLLVVSQFASMELMQPKTDDPAQQQSNVILKVLPLMIGWFSLSVPSALSVYWFVNNIITTATSLIIRNNIQPSPAFSPNAAATGAKAEVTSASIFAPPREKPSGFAGKPSTPSDGVKPLTNVVDATFEKTANVAEQAAEAASDVVDDVQSSVADTSDKSKKRGKKTKKNKN